ncbi:MAG: hypothetical protein ACRCTY_08960 [Candidatus Adiutrix sp.]
MVTPTKTDELEIGRLSQLLDNELESILRQANIATQTTNGPRPLKPTDAPLLANEPKASADESQPHPQEDDDWHLAELSEESWDLNDLVSAEVRLASEDSALDNPSTDDTVDLVLTSPLEGANVNLSTMPQTLSPLNQQTVWPEFKGDMVHRPSRIGDLTPVELGLIIEKAVERALAVALKNFIK